LERAEKRIIDRCADISATIERSDCKKWQLPQARPLLHRDSVNVEAVASLNSDHLLINQARNGDANAFAVLYETHKPRVQTVCLRMTNDATEAEDLAQDAFIYAFRKISTFRGDSAFSTWIHRVAVNTVLMHFRRRNKRQVSLDQTHPQSDGLKPEFGQVDQRLATCVDRLALLRAIEELPPGYRTIFILHQVNGYKHNEIAERMHCSIGNSKSQLHKAKLRLREVLALHGHTFRRRLAAAKPPAVPGADLMGRATLKVVQPSTDTSPRRGDQPRGTGNDGNERKNSGPQRSANAAGPVCEKPVRRSEDLANLLIAGDAEMSAVGDSRGPVGSMAGNGF
jgi:RNA polymerase sigma-70 factor (ECF subfamily)